MMPRVLLDSMPLNRAEKSKVRKVQQSFPEKKKGENGLL